MRKIDEEIGENQIEEKAKILVRIKGKIRVKRKRKVKERTKKWSKVNGGMGAPFLTIVVSWL